MILKPWSVAIEAQLAAFKVADLLVQEDQYSDLRSGWNIDRILLTHATPYMWSAEVMAAVLEASKSIPLDTELNKWNLKSECSWWYFEKPLPFETLTIRASTGVRALALGFLPLKVREQYFPPGTPIAKIERAITTVPVSLAMPVVCWIDSEKEDCGPIIPSQVFEWEEGETLGSMLNKAREHHKTFYGPGGKWHSKVHMETDAFVAVTESLARFILAATSWINQKVIIETEEPLERHRRKEMTKTFQREAPTVRVVSLRKAEYKKTENAETNREYHVRWVVSGHWRHQPCGPKRGDRRLTYILPYIKGPDGAPLREMPHTVYTVDR